MTKAELRKIYLAKKKALSDQERLAKSLKITDLFFQNFNLEAVRLLHIFLSIETAGEFDTSHIIKRLWHDFPLKIKTVVPRINRKTDRLESVEYGAESKLITNYWGISEPAEDKTVAPEKIDLVIVPLLCFDEQGHRVGYGKGFYDKFLTGCRSDCRKIGVSFFSPIAEISDVHQSDVKLDFCITPEKIWQFPVKSPT